MPTSGKVISRSKLDKAMADAGFTSQVELVDKINEIFPDSSPKDSVSRMFRGFPISHKTIIRVTKALNIGYDALFEENEELVNEIDSVSSTQQVILSKKTKSVEDFPSYLDGDQTQNNSPIFSPIFRSRTFKIKLLTLLTLIVVALFFVSQYENDNIALESGIHSLQPPLGKIKILIQSPAELTTFANSFSARLSKLPNFNSIVTSATSNYNISAPDAIDNWEVHAVLKIKLIKGKYYQLTIVTLSTPERSEIILQAINNISVSNSAIEALSTRLIKHTREFVEGKSISDLMTTSKEALKLFLKAKDLLFISYSEKEYQTVHNYLTKVIHLDDNFAQAHAEACRTDVRMSRTKDESTLLERALSYCQVAGKLDPNDILTLTATAELWSRTGRVEKAISLLLPHADNNEFDSDAFSVLADLYLVQEKQNMDGESDLQSEKYALKSLALNSQHWKAYNTLGILYVSRGKMKEAKNHWFNVSKIVKHEVILGNLGTLQFCFNELNSAKQTYRDIINNFQDSYIGYELLGTIHFYEMDFKQAIKNKLIAIDKQPDVAIHLIWSGLAEAFLLDGQVEKAWRYYLQALTIIERDELLEIADIDDQLYKLYYQLKLKQLRPSQQFVENFDKRVDAFVQNRSSLGLKAQSHLAWLAGAANKIQIRDEIWKEISQACPVYKNAPELLTQNLVTSNSIE